jgi:hypothetical protein
MAVNFFWLLKGSFHQNARGGTTALEHQMGENHKNSQKCDSLGKGRPDIRCVKRIHTMLAQGPIKER